MDSSALDGVIMLVPEILGVCTDVISFVVNEPILLVPVAISFVGVGIGLFKRLRH